MDITRESMSRRQVDPGTEDDYVVGRWARHYVIRTGARGRASTRYRRRERRLVSAGLRAGRFEAE